MKTSYENIWFSIEEKIRLTELELMKEARKYATSRGLPEPQNRNECLIISEWAREENNHER